MVEVFMALDSVCLYNQDIECLSVVVENELYCTYRI